MKKSILNRNDDLPGDVNPGGQTEPSVNFDALAAPEGSFNADLEINTDNLPNIDNQINKEMNIDPKASDNQNTDDTNQNQQNSKQQDNQQNQQSQNNDNIPSLDEMKHIYSRMKNKYGDNFEIPDEIKSPDEFLDYVDNFIENVKKIELTPEAQKINDAIKSGVNFDDFLKRYNGMNDFINMSAKDLVSLDFKETYGWDDAKIKATVDKMDQSGLLEIEAEKIKSQIAKNRDALLENMQQQQIQQREQMVNNINKEREKYIKSSIDYFKGLNEVYGIPVSQSEKAEFSEAFRNLVTPDETGNAPLAKALQSDETLIKIAYMLSKGDQKFKEAIHKAKEGAKADWKQRLDPEPRIQKTSGNFEPGAVDLDALAAPAR